MTGDELVRKLESLAQLDIDAVHVYTQALEHVTDAEVREAFVRFQGEHQYHAEQLGDAIERLGGERPEMKIDLMGRMADWVTALRSMSGTSGALHAMKTAERYHNNRYGDAQSWGLEDAGLATTLRRFYDDEKRHLAFVEQRLSGYVTVGGRNESR
ncbi:MAG: ferritin-like domain-containing protein [Coriobacteriia bacterium]